MAMAAAPKLPQLRRIGWRSWDPIGLQSADPDADDEYDAYLIRTADMLNNGSSLQEASAYLQNVEAEHMGLGQRDGSSERAENTVAVVQAYLEQLNAPLQRIELDASGWVSEDHLWNALLAGLGAPDWHGRNYDALWETVTEVARYPSTRESLINRVQPPFQIVVRNAASVPSPISRRLHEIAALLAEAHEEFDLRVGLIAEAPRK
jgi:RNAse (barnase) inhibitor barstar